MEPLPPLVFPLEALVVAAIGAVLIGISFFIPRARIWDTDTRDAVASIGGIAIGWAFLSGLPNVAGPFFEYYVPAIFASGWAAVAAILLALALYMLRRSYLGAYGAVEIIGALATIFVCASTNYGSPFERGAALAGAVYFLVRGLDNAEKGDFWIGAFAKIRRFRPSPSLVVAWCTITLMVCLMFYTESRQTVEPPYMVDIRGGDRTPVSPMMCGRLYIECDAAAWREHRRLKLGTQAQRDAAERAADQRRWALDPECKISADNPACRWTPRFPGPGRVKPEAQ